MPLHEFLFIPFVRDLVEIAGFAVAEGVICYVVLRYIESHLRVRRPLV